MHNIPVILSVVLVAIIAVTGLAAITTGWMPPRARESVVRPKLWGAGALLAAVGVSLLYVGVLRDTGALNPYVWPAGLVALVAGIFVQHRGE